MLYIFHRRYLHLDVGTLYRVIGLAYLEDPSAMPAVAELLVGSPLPDRMRVRGQTKRDNLVLQVGG